jgi:hypothetical protein
MEATAGEDEDIFNGDATNSPGRFHSIEPTWPDASAAIEGGFFHVQIIDGGTDMEFFISAVSTLQTLVIALGAGLAVCVL